LLNYRDEALFRGTFAPFLRASERPIAIACLRLFTVPPFPPRPDFSVPFFFRRIALATVLPAAFPYRRPLLFLEVLRCCGMVPSLKGLESAIVEEVGRVPEHANAVNSRSSRVENVFRGAGLASGLKVNLLPKLLQSL
jgi:hypothetical protein